jgi:hypothetical protein
MLSIVPAVFPILKEPALSPPTVAGPMIHFCFALAVAAMIRVCRSGMPSAMTAIVRIVSVAMASIVESKAERCEAKVTITSASGHRFTASAMVFTLGMVISFVPQKNFSNPPRSGVIIAATLGASLRHR